MAAPNTKKKATIKSTVLVPVQDTDEVIGAQFKYLPVTDFGGNGGGGGTVTTLAEFIASNDIPTNGPVITTDKGGGTWYYAGLNDSQYVSDGITIVVTADDRLWKRIYLNGTFSAEWFGAKGDGVTDNAPAFKSMMNAYRGLEWKPAISIGVGHFICNDEVQFDGGPAIGMPYIQGAGSLNTILDFTNSVKSTAIRFGNAKSQVNLSDVPNSTLQDLRANSLHGGIKGIKIIGTTTIDGLINASYAPTATAFNQFEDIYIYNCRDGVNYDVNPSNESSGFRNVYRNIRIERYSRIGFTANGAYNDHYFVFVTQPNGETNTVNPDTTKGSANLGLKVSGSNQTFHSCQFEDQIYSLGGACTFHNVSIENMCKGQPHSLCGDAAMVISGVDNQFFNLKFTTLHNGFLTTLVKCFSLNSTFVNATYANPGNVSNFTMQWPIIPFGDSTGVMINCYIPTSILQSHYSIFNDKWAYINVFNGVGVNPYYKIPIVPPNLNDVILVNQIATTTPEFREGLIIGDYAAERSLQVEGYIDFRVLNAPVGRIKVNNNDARNGGVTLQYLKDKGARASATVSGGVLATISLDAGGASYSSNTTVIIGQQWGRGAKITPTISGGVITALTLTDPGHGYTGVPDIFFVDFNDGLIVDKDGRAYFAGRVKGADAVNTDEFTTLLQINNKKAAALTAAALPTTASATYLQTDIQKLIDRVNDLETKLREAPNGGLLT